MHRRTLHSFRTITIAIAITLSAPTLWGQGSNSCSLAGTWFGGSDAAKYLGFISPGTGSDFAVIFDGAFSLSTLGFPVKTVFVGSIVKNHGAYEMYAIGMVNASAQFPATTPQVWAVHGTVRLIDCNTLRMDDDFFGAYLWTSNKTPFLDSPDYVVAPPPITETYRRMPVTRDAQNRDLAVIK